MRAFTYALLGALALMVSCAATPSPRPDASGAVQPPSLDELLSGLGDPPTLVRLENGLTVLVKQDDRFPLVNVRLYVHAGSSYEDPAQAGISHLLEHMVFQGTERRGEGESALAIESAGGSVNAGTSFDYTVYYAEVPSASWRLGMDVVEDMAFHALIDPENLESERQVVLSELERGEDEPGSRLFKAIQAQLWEGTPYAWPVIGFRETVEGISAQDIHDYVDRLYQPQSMTLCVVGDVNPDEVLAEAEALFGGRTNTAATVPPAPIHIPAAGGGPVVQIVPGPWNKVYLAAAWPIPGLDSSQISGIELLAQILGGDETSRLFRTFKYDRRLVDDISLVPYSLGRSGILYLSATLDADKVAEFWPALISELAAVDPGGFTDAEIERARLNLQNSLFLAKETLAGLAGKLGFFQFFMNGQQAEANYLFELSQAGRAEMAQLARTYLRPDQMAASVLVPQGAQADASAMERAVRQEWPAPQSGQAQARAEAATRQIIALPGGSTLVLLPDTTLPYAALSLSWIGGDSLLTPDQQGLGALAASALTRGTRTMTANQIEDFLSDRAASMAASCGRSTFGFSAKYPSRFADDLLPLYREVLTAPAWSDDEMDRARQDQIASIALREDRPLGLAFRRIFPFLFASAPYDYMHNGEPQAVAAMTGDDTAAFWRVQRTRPFTMAVCGQFDPERYIAFAKNLAETLASDGTPFEFTEPQWSQEREATLTLPERNQAHVLAVFPCPGMLDLDASARLSVLRAALAGQSGMLFRDLRDDQGLGYTVTAFLWQVPRAGFMAFYIGTTPEQVDQALAGFQAAADSLGATPLPQDELDRARNILTGEYYQDRQSLLSRSGEASSLLTLGMPMDREQQLLDLAAGLSAEDLRQTAQEYLDWSRVYILKVEP